MRTRTMHPATSTQPRRPHLSLVLVALIGFGFALYRFGRHVLNPRNITWFQGDSTWHFLVWHFFRREAWGLPPGRVEGFMAPLGTSIGSADALPLLAFPLKLFSAALPPDFQYLGPWLFICYALQGIFGYLLARTCCRNHGLALLIGLFFLFSPIMIFRAGHIALSSHWILLFALWHYFASAQRPNLELRSYAGLWLLITALVGLIHPYLAAMVFPIAFVSLLREWAFSKRLQLRPALTLLFGMAAVLALEWWLSGLIGAGQNLELWGFDHFSMNLNALVNPLTRSRLLPALPLGAGQYEGFAYLGLGILGLGLLALALLFRTSARTVPQRAWERLRAAGHLPLALLALGFTLFAFGRTLTLGTAELFELPLFTNFTTLTTAFRAPGRFFWPTYYLLYMLILAFLVRRLPPVTATLLLSAGLLVQVSELRISSPFPDAQPTFTGNLQDERWAQLVAPFDTVAVIPAFERTVANRGDYAAFAYLAASRGKRVTTGAAARPPANLEAVKEQLEREALEGPRDPGTLYVFSAATFATTYLTKLEPGLRCHELGAYVACYGRERSLAQFGPGIDLQRYLPPGYERVSLADYLKRYEDLTVVLVAKEGVGDTLGAAQDLLSAQGSRIGELTPEGAYAAVLHQGQVVFERSAESDLVRPEWDEDTVLESAVSRLALPKSLGIVSGGTAAVKSARIVVDGASVLQTERGLNVAVLDDQFNLVSRANFDTFVTDEGVIER